MGKQVCETCGSDRIYSGPPDCPSCGAPNCCQTCCKQTTLEIEIDQLKSQKAALLAACKLIGDEITDDIKKDVTPKGGVAIFLSLKQLKQIESAIAAGESGDE